jgi:mannosyltransferase
LPTRISLGPAARVENGAASTRAVAPPPSASAESNALPYARAAAAALLLGAALRAWGLARYPLEQDELYTVWEGRDLWGVALSPGIDARPLYFLLQHVLLRLLPETPTALRLAPFVFGVLGIWAVWKVGGRVAGPAAGAVAALLVAISPWHLHASGMARYWTLLFLLSTLFLGALWKAYGSDRPRDHALALLPLVLGSATHPTFLFPAAGAALGVTLVRRDGRFGWRWPSPAAWRWLWGPYLAFLALAAVALRLAGREEAVRNWGGRGWLATLRLVPAIVEWATPTLVAAGVLGALALALGRDPGRRRWGAMALCGGVSAIALLVAASTRTDVYADYAIAALPLLFVGAGALVQLGVERMTAGRGAAVAVAAAAAVLAAGVFPGTVSHLADGTRFDYRPALRRVERVAPQTTVAVWPVVVARHYAPGLRITDLRAGARALDRLLAAEGDLWVIESVRRYGFVGDDGSIAAWLARRCTLELAHERLRWDYRVYRVELYRCRAGAQPGAR